MKTTKNKTVYEKDINNLKGKANTIVFPDGDEEIRNIIKLSELDIIPRGSGMSFSSACLPNDSVIIDMSKKNKIIEVDKIKKTVYLEAGVIIDELNQELEKYGLELPIEPIFSGIRTIGGVIATNSSGGRELKYGRIRNWIDSLEVIDGKGELLNISKSDASDFVGMEGTNGIIVRAKLRLTTKKQRTISILRTDSVEQIIELGKKLKLDHEVSMFKLIGKKLSRLLGLQSKYHIFIEYESSKGTMREEKYEEFSRLLNKCYPCLASNDYPMLEDPRFFMDKIKDFFFYLEERDIPYFCNLGSGVVYCAFQDKEKEKKENTLEFVKRIRGRVSDSLGIGLTKKQFLDRTEIEIIKRIKARHDPQNKFNRNKLIDYTPEKTKEPVQEPSQNEEIQETKTPEQIMEEFIEEQKIDEILSAKPIEEKK